MKRFFIEDVVVLIERLFVYTGLLSLAALHGHAAVLDDLVDRLHRVLGGLAPDVSRHAAGSGEHHRIPILSIDDMCRVEVPNVECGCGCGCGWPVKLEVRDAMIMKMVPEAEKDGHPLELALLDLETEVGVDILLGEAGDWQQATARRSRSGRGRSLGAHAQLHGGCGGEPVGQHKDGDGSGPPNVTVIIAVVVKEGLLGIRVAIFGVHAQLQGGCGGEPGAAVDNV